MDSATIKATFQRDLHEISLPPDNLVNEAAINQRALAGVLSYIVEVAMPFLTLLEMD